MFWTHSPLQRAVSKSHYVVKFQLDIRYAFIKIKILNHWC
jgi:hypothetical protein